MGSALYVLKLQCDCPSIKAGEEPATKNSAGPITKHGMKSVLYKAKNAATAIKTLASYQGELGSIPVGSPGFRKRESCRTMPFVGGFSRGYPVSPAPSFRRYSIFTSIALIGSQDLANNEKDGVWFTTRKTYGTCCQLLNSTYVSNTFDKAAASVKSNGTATSKAIVEVKLHNSENSDWDNTPLKSTSFLVALPSNDGVGETQTKNSQLVFPSTILPAIIASDVISKATGTSAKHKKPIRVIEVSKERRRDERAVEAGDPREDPPTSGIVWHGSPWSTRSIDLCVSTYQLPIGANYTGSAYHIDEFHYWLSAGQSIGELAVSRSKFGRLLRARSSEPVRVIEASMERRRGGIFLRLVQTEADPSLEDYTEGQRTKIVRTLLVVSGVVWTNRTMVSSNTDTNRTGVLAEVDTEADIGADYSRRETRQKCVDICVGGVGRYAFHAQRSENRVSLSYNRVLEDCAFCASCRNFLIQNCWWDDRICRAHVRSTLHFVGCLVVRVVLGLCESGIMSRERQSTFTDIAKSLKKNMFSRQPAMHLTQQVGAPASLITLLPPRRGRNKGASVDAVLFPLSDRYWWRYTADDARTTSDQCRRSFFPPE
ncbi:hypothetical protein PR048_033328 [Dryococelus australis]|uniref:Uncharacterized protein n=1 Tax=Dryococelus australis TaxID=614101 RepID=A0ABQ9FZZ4_9NEOP|nr:hypothetical protein PR048_033328 [Dryococelus australis]